MIMHYMFILLFFLCIGIISGLFLRKQYITHGPNAHIIQKQIFYDYKTKKYYKFKYYLVKSPLKKNFIDKCITYIK